MLYAVDLHRIIGWVFASMAEVKLIKERARVRSNKSLFEEMSIAV